MHPYALSRFVEQHQHELISHAEQYRLLSAARRARHSRRAGGTAGPRMPVRGQPANAVRPRHA